MDIDKENVGALELSDDVLNNASGGSKGYEGDLGDSYLLRIGDEMYLFDNKEDADAFRNGYYAKKGAEANPSPIK